MQLDSLIASLPGVVETPGVISHISITDVTTDPNLCRPGFIYVADESETVDSTKLGVRLDGRDFIPLAMRNGASAILTTPNVVNLNELAPRVALFVHDQPLSLLGEIASRLCGEPKPQTVALVTGTNGKTSVVNFCRMLWTASGRPSCSVGNLGGVCSDGSLVWDRDPTLSVPETVFLHKMLHKLASKGTNHVALEATSHALFDYRLHGVRANIGAFTNLTRDHLDFHNTLAEYFSVKMKLFTEVLPENSFAVLNADAEWFSNALPICKSRHHKILCYGKNGSDIRVLNSQLHKGGQLLTLEVFGTRYQVNLGLAGEFQLSNAMCSLAIAIASGIEAAEAVQLLSSLQEVEGRLNTVAITPSGGRIIVDYAHTPDGIRAALDACRSITAGKVIIVFGANGDRDPGKREEMGTMAAHLADEVIVTDGHPRHENPASIRAAVRRGAQAAKEIPGRAEAIRYAIRSLADGDTLLIAGMGHEKFQVIGDQSIPFSDGDFAKRVAEELHTTGAQR